MSGLTYLEIIVPTHHVCRSRLVITH